MEKFIKISGIAAPFTRINVDTDLIIPAEHLKTISRTGLGKHLFSYIRYSENGSKKKEFILNKDHYEKYLTHQPYEDCKSLEVDRVVETKIGSLIYWDRVRIHSSDNFIKNNVKSKTVLALFTSKTKI